MLTAGCCCSCLVEACLLLQVCCMAASSVRAVVGQAGAGTCFCWLAFVMVVANVHCKGCSCLGCYGASAGSGNYVQRLLVNCKRRLREQSRQQHAAASVAAKLALLCLHRQSLTGRGVCWGWLRGQLQCMPLMIVSPAGDTPYNLLCTAQLPVMHVVDLWVH